MRPPPSRLLVMERLVGVPLTDLAAVRSITMRDPESVLINALNTWFASVMGAETFHADVHAGVRVCWVGGCRCGCGCDVCACAGSSCGPERDGSAMCSSGMRWQRQWSMRRCMRPCVRAHTVRPPPRPPALPRPCTPANPAPRAPPHPSPRLPALPRSPFPRQPSGAA